MVFSWIKDISWIMFMMFMIFAGLVVSGMLLAIIVYLVFKYKYKTDYQPDKLLREILDENEAKDIIVEEHKFIRKTNNYNKTTNILKIRKRDQNDKSLLKIYDVLVNFYTAFVKKNQRKSYLSFLNIANWVFVIIFITLITCIATVLSFASTTVDKNEAELYSNVILVISIIELIASLIGWFFWAFSIEEIGKEINELANDYLTASEAKKIKSLIIFKTCFPLTEYLFWG